MEELLSRCYAINLDQTKMNSDLVKFISAYSSSKQLPFAAVFTGILAATSSICSKSFVKVHEEALGLDAYNVSLNLFVVNVGLASANKSCCTDLIKGAFRKMEIFLNKDPTPLSNIENVDESKEESLAACKQPMASSLDNSATIEGLLASLNEQPSSRFQVWDELTTLVSSFGLYKPGGGAWDQSFILTLYNSPDNMMHKTKKYEYNIDFPRLAILASDHPETLRKYLALDQNSSTAFWARWLVHVCKAERRRLDAHVAFSEAFTLDVLFSCLKVIYTTPISFTFTITTKKLVADVYEEFDKIADANELTTPYITSVFGKSKTHFMRILGCLWALDVAFLTLKSMTAIPTEKTLFISEVLAKYAILNEPSVITISTVTKAKMVVDYFIKHKLVMSELEKDETSEFRFIKKTEAVQSTKLSASVTTTRKSTTPATLEQRILLTSGPIVFLTPLSTQKVANRDSFKVSCSNLESKGLGTSGSFLTDENSSRSAAGFKKNPVPAESSEATLLFTNSLLDFNVTVAEFSKTLSEPNIINEKNKSAPKSDTPSSTSQKRTAKMTSMENISGAQKSSKAEAVQSTKLSASFATTRKSTTSDEDD